MNVLQICPAYFGRPLFKMLFESLEKKNVNNSIYVPKWRHEDNGQTDNVIVIDKKFSKLSKLFYWREMHYVFNDVQKRIDLSHLNVVHAHRLLEGGDVAYEIKKKYGIPYIVAIRNSDLNCFGRNIFVYKKYCWSIISNAEKVVFISEVYKERVCKLYSKKPNAQIVFEKFLTIPNGIDDSFLAVKSPKCRNVSDKRLSIISVANIDKNKNALTTLKACDILIERGYDVTYNFAGNILNNRLFDIIRKKPYSNYLGILTKEQIKESLMKADIFVMPSIHETFGIVYAEAISQGVPIIYTCGEGFDGQFEEGVVGFHVNCKNASEIVDKIIVILSDYCNFSNRCIFNAERYSWEGIAQRYSQVYNECTSNHLV